MAVWNWIVDTAAGWSTLGVTLRLLLALIVGLVVGIDRELKRRGAGIKTHVLVCLGAAAVMITSEYLFVKFGGDLDLSRMGAQVISGVGFLGVGTIIVTGRNQVRGLTTQQQAYGSVLAWDLRPVSDMSKESSSHCCS